MALQCVEVSGDTFMTCLCHALSTEGEEVMGLLFGAPRARRSSSAASPL